MENQVATKDDMAQMKEDMAMAAGEKRNSFSTMPSINVFNKKAEGGEESEFSLGDIYESLKTEDGWENNLCQKPFDGVILKTRMYLTTKYKLKDIVGIPNLMSDEFDGYGNTQITIKEKDSEGKYTPVFVGTYKQIHEKFSNSTDKYLELRHSVFVLLKGDESKIVRFDIKGMSRGNYIEYMNSFSQKDSEHMIGFVTHFDSIQMEKDQKGKALAFTVFAFDFKRGVELNYEQLTRVNSIQKQFMVELADRDAMFAGQDSGEKPKEIEASKEKEEDIPTINLDDEEQENQTVIEEAPKSDEPF